MGDIRSPAHSDLYPDNTLCSWLITIPPESSGQIQLLFTSFALERCSGCSCDYVEVLDVVGQTNVSLGRFCGRQVPGPFYSSGKRLYVVFKSDHGDAKAGFKASYTQVAAGQGGSAALSDFVFLTETVNTTAKIGWDPSGMWSEPNTFVVEKIMWVFWIHRRLQTHENVAIPYQKYRVRINFLWTGPDQFLAVV